MNKVALIIPWVGNLPWYWELWQKSAVGRAFDIIVIRKTEAEFKALAERVLGTAVNLTRGYKLCDLRPMFGLLFAEELRGYDYWAYGDCDLMYGRMLDAWIERVVAGDYDVASVQAEFTSGPFTIVKNCERCNRLFEKSSRWREILQCERTMAFDELGDRWFRKWLFGHHSYERLRRELGSFTAVCWHEREAGRLKMLSEAVICEDGLEGGLRAVWHPDGSVAVGDREVALFHFICAKRRFGFTGDDHSVWVSHGWLRVRDFLRFALQWVRGNRPARRRVWEWWQRRRGSKDWWQGAAWNE